MDIVDKLRTYKRDRSGYAEYCHRAADEIERLRKIIDSRPDINAGLPETYIQWSQSIYAIEYAQAVGYDA